VEVQERVIYSARLSPGTLTLIRPDGTGKRDGDGPAWLPDNSGLISARNQALWRVAADGSGAVELPNTRLGSTPAVSRDGRYVAFTRQKQGLDWNIWVLRLDAGR
jgi:Tol biopolymer transport system component